MLKRAFIFLFAGFIVSNVCEAQQFFFRTSDLFQQRLNSNTEAGELNIYQSPSMDTLLSRYVYYHKINGMQGFRIQVFRSGTRTARADAEKVMAEFIIEFPDFMPYLQYMKPGYFMVRVGNYRTMLESAKDLYMIRRKYPDAYAVPCEINFPDLNTN